MQTVEEKQLDEDIVVLENLVEYYKDLFNKTIYKLEQLKERKKSIELYNKKD